MSSAPTLRVVHAYKDVYPPIEGGIEKHVDTLRRTVPACTADVLVCARGRRTRVQRVAAGQEYLVGEYGRLLSTPISPAYVRWMARLPSDLFHLHLPFPLAELGAVTALRHRPYVVGYHADIVRQAWLLPVYGPLIQACLRRARRIIAGSHALRDRSPLLAAHRERVVVVPYAIDTDYWAASEVSREDRERTLARYDAPLIVAVGRLVYYKGFEHLIRAAQGLKAHVVIVGDGPLRRHLAALASETTNVTLAGRLGDADLRTLLSAADLFVLPSINRAESFGISTLEAQAMGLPAIVTDVGTGTVEAIEPDRTGIVVRPAGVAELAEALRMLLSDPDRLSGMSVAARRRAVDIHGQASAANAIRQIYADVTGH